MKPSCSRPACERTSQNRGLCKYHYPAAYPPHLRGDVDTGRARRHVAKLRARGVTLDMLGKQGIDRTVIGRIERGQQRIRALTEAKVLAVPLPTAWVASLADVDATGTHRRLRALAAIGYSQVVLGEHLGMVQNRVSAILQHPRVSGATAARVADVFTLLQMRPGPSVLARRYALRRGWPPPLQWDEESIDDPGAQPHTDGRHPSAAERIAELQDLGIYDTAAIAERLGIQESSVKRHFMPSRARQAS